MESPDSHLCASLMSNARAIQRKAREVFGHIGFREEGHQYLKHGKVVDWPSASSVYKRYVDEPDWDEVAGKKAVREGISKEVLLRQWDDKKIEACERGNRVHKFAEDYARGMTRRELRRRLNGKKGVERLQMLSVIEFFDTLPSHLEVVLLELKMEHPEFKLFGMADIALFDTQRNCLVITDHKTNEDIFKGFGYRKMEPPFTFLDDMAYNHYQIQLNVYQLMVEQLGYPVGGRLLVWHKHDGDRKLFYLNDFTDILKMELAA